MSAAGIYALVATIAAVIFATLWVLEAFVGSPGQWREIAQLQARNTELRSSRDRAVDETRKHIKTVREVAAGLRETIVEMHRDVTAADAPRKKLAIEAKAALADAEEKAVEMANGIMEHVRRMRDARAFIDTDARGLDKFVEAFDRLAERLDEVPDVGQDRTDQVFDDLKRAINGACPTASEAAERLNAAVARRFDKIEKKSEANEPGHWRLCFWCNRIKGEHVVSGSELLCPVDTDGGPNEVGRVFTPNRRTQQAE